MFPSILQRDTSAHRLSYPRLVHCDVTFQPGPKPVPPPRLPPPALLAPSTASLDWSIEQQVIDECRQRRRAEEEAAAQRRRRDEAEARQRADAAAERRRREDEERKEAEGNRKRHEMEQEKLRHIAEAYKKQRAAVEAFSVKSHAPASASTASASSSAGLPVAPPVNRAGRPLLSHPLLSGAQPSAAADDASGGSGGAAASASAVQSFQSITGVSDGANAALLLSLLDGDVDQAVNVYFSDPGQADIHAAIDKAITIQERKHQQQQQQR